MAPSQSLAAWSMLQPVHFRCNAPVPRRRIQARLNQPSYCESNQSWRRYYRGRRYLRGDGVNIAARLEPLAEPGGVCVSSIVNESVGNRIDVRFSDGGDEQAKNIERPIRVQRRIRQDGRRPNRSIAATGGAQGRKLSRSPFCRSPALRQATSNRNTSTASAKTSSPICRRSPAYW